MNGMYMCVYRDNDGAVYHTVHEMCYSEHDDTTSSLRLACSATFESMSVRCNLVQKTQDSGCLRVRDTLESYPRPADVKLYTYFFYDKLDLSGTRKGFPR